MVRLLLTPPAAMPVSLAQAKEFMKIETNDDDQLITDLIDQATSHISALCDRQLITQTWRVFFDDLPATKLLTLELAPVQSIVEVRYFDGDGIAQTIAATDYEVDRYSSPARISFKTIPCIGPDLNGLEVDVIAGYGASSVDMPGNLIRAMLITIAHWYEFRGAVHPADQPLSNPAGLGALLAPYQSRGL